MSILDDWNREFGLPDVEVDPVGAIREPDDVTRRPAPQPQGNILSQWDAEAGAQVEADAEMGRQVQAQEQRPFLEKAGGVAAGAFESAAAGITDIEHSWLANVENRDLNEIAASYTGVPGFFRHSMFGRFMRPYGLPEEVDAELKKAAAERGEAGVKNRIKQYIHQERARIAGKRAEEPEYKKAFSGPVSGRIEDAIIGMSRFAPAMGMTAVNAPIGFKFTFEQIHGYKYNELIKRGIERDVAHDAALLEAAISAPLETAGNLFGLRAVKGIAKGVITPAAIGPKTRKIITNLLLGSAGEGLEEYLQKYPEALADIYADDPDASIDEIKERFIEKVAFLDSGGHLSEWQKQAMSEGLTGAIGGALLPGAAGAIVTPSAIKRDIQVRKRAKRIRDVREGKNILPGATEEEVVPEKITGKADVNAMIERAAARTEGAIPEGPPTDAPVAPTAPIAPTATEPGSIEEQWLEEAIREQEIAPMEARAEEILAPSAARLTEEEQLRPQVFPPQIPGPRPAEPIYPAETEPVYEALPFAHERQIGVTARQPVIPEKPAREYTAEELAEMPQAELDKIPTEARARALMGPEATEEEVQRLAKDAEKLKAQKTLSDVEVAAEATDVAPTEAQIEAGNYKKGHVNIEGLDISIETPKGAVRSGVDRREKKWSQKMRSHYGYIRGVTGGENEQLDVFLGTSRDYGTVYVVDQIDPATGKFDEHKVMIGYPSAKAAKAAYLANYEKGWKGAKKVHAMPMAAFKKWTQRVQPKKPLSEQIPITREEWLADPAVRPKGYSKAEYIPDAPGRIAQVTNRTIAKEYETYASEFVVKPTKFEEAEAGIIVQRPYVKKGELKEVKVEEIKGPRMREWLAVKALADAFKIDFVVVDPGDVKIGLNAVWLNDERIIVMNINNPRPLMTTFIHELTHSMIEGDSALYRDLERYIKEKTGQEAYDRWIADYKGTLTRLIEYKLKQELDRDPTTEELEAAVEKAMPSDKIMGYEFTAYSVGILSQKQSFWDTMAKSNPNLFGRVAKFIADVVKRVRDALFNYAKYSDVISFNDSLDNVARYVANAFVMYAEGSISADMAEDLRAEAFFEVAPAAEIRIDKKKGADNVVLDAISGLADGRENITLEKGKDYGIRPIIESIGFVRQGNTDTYKFDERIPKDADIIAGMYQAAWHTDIATKRSTKKLFGEVSKRLGEYQRGRVGKKEQAADKKRLQDYLNRSWLTYQPAADQTDRGDQLPVKNVLVRPKDVKSGKGRQLLVQISSDLRAEEASHIGDAYYEAIYSERDGYARPSRDFWEVPEWMTRLAYFMPKADVYVIRNLKEAKEFLNEAKYDNVFFSVLDTNKRFVKEIAEDYPGKIVAGGYLPDGSYYKGMKNVSWMADMQQAAKKLKIPFKNGVDYRHFKGTRTIPRLELSKGCLHKCAFCSQDRELTLATPEEIDNQIKEFKSFDYELVYLNDKTFGQASNYTQLVEIKEKIKKENPNFKGFIIQTTAAAYLKMSDEFLKKSGIVYVELGVETFNNKFLKSLHKPHTTQMIEKAADKIRRLNQVFVPNVMVGLTGKTEPSKKDVYYRGSRTGDLIKMPERAAYYFTRNRSLAEDYGDVVNKYVVDTGRMWDNEKPNDLDPKIMKMMEKHPEFPSEEFHKGTDRYFDWAVLEDPKISKALQDAGYDSYKTSEGGFTSIGVFDTKNVKDFKAVGTRWVESADTYKNTLDFLKRNRDIISHLNIGVLAAETGTELQKQLDDWQEVDTDEATMERSWIKNKDVHEKFYYDLSKLGTEQLEKAKMDIYVDSAYEVSALAEIEEEAIGETEVLFDISAEDEIEGKKGTAVGNKLYWDVSKIAEAAGGWKKISDYLGQINEWKGVPITKAAIKYMGNLGNALSKDAKRRNKVKAIENFRDRLSTGEINEYSPEYTKAVKKYGSDLQLFTVKRQKRFFVGVNTIYGPKEKGDITQKVKKDHALLGPFETEVTRDKKFKLVMDTPILPLDYNKRQDAIDKIVKENKQYLSWYDDWNAFVKSFKHLPEAKLVKYIKMMAVFSAGAGPQGNMKKFTEAVNKLESGRELKAGPISKGGDGIAKSDLPKIMAIWEDADPATTLEERRQIYGPKVGTYMHMGLFPRAVGVVIDRHMPRLWGYDITWSPNMQYNNFRVMPQVEREVAEDIKTVAKRNDLSTSAVQAALWYKSRTPDVEASTYKEAAALKPSTYLPGVMHDRLRTEYLGVGKHFKETPLKKGEFILAAKRDGSVKYNSYSRDDIGNRIYGHTDKNPYAELVYFYEAGTAPEIQLKGKPNVYTVDFDRQRIYDGVEDPLGYWAYAAERLKADPFANLTNIFANMVEATGDFDGFVVNAPVGEGRWVLMFKKAEITGVPENVVAGISDVVDSLEPEFPQTIKGISAIFHGRSDELYKKFKSLASKYAEVKIEYFKPTVARFQGATQGKHEISGMASIRGPLKAIRAMFAEFGISNIQNNVILVHTEEGAERNGSFYRFKVKRDFGSMEAVYQKIASHGLQDYNISVNTQAGSFYIEQFVLDEYSDDFVEHFTMMIEEIAEKNFPQNITYRATSEVLGDPNWSGQPAKALKYYKDNLIDYFGEKEGKARYAKAIKEAQKYRNEIGKRKDSGETLFDIADEVGEDRGQDYGRAVESQDVIGQFAKPGEILFDINDDVRGEEESRADMWYSQLVNMVESKFPGKSSTKNYITMLEGMVKKGHIKQTELDWSGLVEWLEDQKSPVLKKNIEEYLRRNHLQIDELQFGGPVDSSEDMREGLSIEFMNWVYEVHPNGVSPWGDESFEWLQDELDQWVKAGGSLDNAAKYPIAKKAMFEVRYIGKMEQPGIQMTYEDFLEEFSEEYTPTRYGEYTIDEEASPDYVELVLTAPITTPQIVNNAVKALDWYNEKTGGAIKIEAVDPDIINEDQRKMVLQGKKINALRKLALYKLQKEGAPKHMIMDFKKWQMGTFRLPHWDSVGIENGIAHLRADRKEIDNKNTLFIEEIQSDWAQRGRKQGFVDIRKAAPVGYHMVKQASGPLMAWIKRPPTDKGRREYVEERLKKPKLGDYTYQLYEDSTGKLVAEGETTDDTIRKAGFNPQTFVPASPLILSKDWALAVLKRAVRYAAEQGYEQIAWTDGKTQAERYKEAFRKNVDALYFNRKTGKLRASYNGVEVFSKNLSNENELEDYVGKENAKKLLNPKSFQRDDAKLQDLYDQKYSIYRSFLLYIDEKMEEYLDKKEIEALPAEYGSIEVFPSMMDYTMGDLIDKPEHWVYYARAFNKSGLAEDYQTIKGNIQMFESQSKGVATSLIDTTDGDVVVEGDGIVTDTKGMVGFYDEIVPGVFKRFFGKKKWGSPKLQKTILYAGDERAAKLNVVSTRDFTVLIYEQQEDEAAGRTIHRTVTVGNLPAWGPGNAALLYLDKNTVYNVGNFYHKMAGISGQQIIDDLDAYHKRPATRSRADVARPAAERAPSGIPEGYKSIYEYYIQAVLPALNIQLESVRPVYDVWAAPVTDKMRGKAIEEGFPMFDIEESDIPAKTGAVLKDKIGRKQKKMSTKIAESVKDYMENWQTNMVDKMYPIKDWFGSLSNAYMLHRGLPGVQSTLNAFMEHGRLKMREDGSIITEENNNGFLKWLDGLGQDAEKFLYWQIAKRSEKLTEEDRELLLTNTDRQKIYDWVGKKPKNRDSWQEISDEFAEWNQSMLDMAVESGLITKEQMKGWMTDYYIPFYRIFENEEARMEFVRGPAKGKKYISAEIKRLRGTERRMGDPMENIIRNWSSLLTNSMNNRARREVFQFADKNKLTTGKMRLNEDGTETPEPLIEKIPWSKTVIFKPVGEKGGPTFVQEKTGEPVLAFKDGGKSVFFRVNDPELFGALSSVNQQYFDNILMSVMSGSKRLLTLGATVTPAFRIANMLRDTLHTFQISDNFIPFIDTARGFMKIWNKDPEYAEFMASGHAFGGSYIRADDPAAMQKYVNRIIKKEGQGAKARILDTPARMWRFWEAIGEASENAARVQLYSNLKKKGKTHMEAAFSARDLMDFQMSGGSGVVQFLIQTIPFLNARVQGLYKMGRSFAENPKAFMAKGALIATASLALWLLYWDDDRYKELEDWEKWAYYHFWIGDAHFRIPKPFETGVIFSSSVEAAANVMSGNDEIEHVFNYLKHAFLETFAFNPVPQLIRPAAEIYMNKSFFTGRPIESMSQKRLRPGDRFDPWDSETLRLLGDQLNISPKKAKTLIRGYTASLGMGILALSDMMVRNIADFPERPAKSIGEYPAIGRFVKGPVSRYTKHMSKFYDLYNEVDELVGTVNNYKRTGQFEKARSMVQKNRKKLAMRKGLGAVRKRLGDIALEMRRVWYSRTLTADQKHERLQELTKKRNELVQRVYEKYLEK